MVEIRIGDASAPAEVRRAAVAVAQAQGFDEVLTGQVAIVATELATNVLKHAERGSLVVGDAERAVDLVALDRGPGIADLRASFADGYSTAGTAGNGLGAVRRLSQAFEIVSWPGKGTVAWARLAAPGAPPSGRVGAIEIAMAGEDACGDAWALHEDPEGCTLFVVDGLGHGSEAAIAAQEAIRQFRRSVGDTPVGILEAVHRALRHTRGGAIAVARVAWASATVVYAGIGNISGSVVAPGGALRRMVSHNGTAGHNARKTQAFEYPHGSGPLIMHTDGIATSWTLDAYPGLVRAHPMLIAGVLYRDHARGRDDATVVVTRTAR